MMKIYILLLWEKLHTWSGEKKIHDFYKEAARLFICFNVIYHKLRKSWWPPHNKSSYPCSPMEKEDNFNILEK